MTEGQAHQRRERGEDTTVVMLGKRVAVLESDVQDVKGDVSALKDGQEEIRGVGNRTHALVELVLIEIRGDADGGGNKGLWPTVREGDERLRTLEQAQIAKTAASDTWSKALGIFIKYILPLLGGVGIGGAITTTMTNGGTP